jgi:hypothetical protein
LVPVPCGNRKLFQSPYPVLTNFFFNYHKVWWLNFLNRHKVYGDWNGYSFSCPYVCFKQLENVYDPSWPKVDLGWPYTNVMQGCIYIQMCPLCCNRHTNVVTTMLTIFKCGIWKF